MSVPESREPLDAACEFLRQHADEGDDAGLSEVADLLADIANGAWTLVRQGRLTPEQVERIWQLRRGGPVNLWTIPDGSWLAVRRLDAGLWIEVVDPVASCLLAFDFDSSDRLLSGFPEGGDA